MNTKRWFILSVALWVLTIAAFGYLFVKGWTIQESQDPRIAVVLTPAERELILGEMRQLLKSVHGVMRGVSSKDLGSAEKVARDAGMQMAADVNPLLLVKLPLPFKAMGMSVHRDFDGLADGIKAGEGGEQVLKRLSDVTSRCAACHDLYRFSK